MRRQAVAPSLMLVGARLDPMVVGSLRKVDALEHGAELMPRIKATTVTAYVKAAPAEAQAKLREIRALLKEVAPGATESIKWGSPVFETDRILFAYNAHKSHMNFVPTESALTPFRDELAQFKTGKDSVQLPYDKPLPKELIRRIAKLRVQQVKGGAKWKA